jgi:predicted phage baseplate assembly protein
VSAVVADERVFAMSVARGNLVLVDHGLRVDETHVLDKSSVQYSGVAHRIRLKQGPLTYGTRWQRAGEPSLSGSVGSLFRLEPHDAEPAVVMVDGGGAGLVWMPEPNLLDSDSFSRSFVAEPANDGRALLRFGDGDFGMEPPVDEDLDVIYRVGNGRGGNVGAETLVHVIKPDVLGPGAVWPTINSVRNPVPGRGGIDPEPLAKVKQIAPDAFRAETFRAVTEDDYAKAAEKLPGVSHAVSRFRWTGSWYTVFTAVDPLGTDAPLSELTVLRADVLRQLTAYKQAGYDLEIPDQQYVPLDIAIEICVAPDHFRSSVRVAVVAALSALVLPSGSLGFFHPDNFTFGQSLYLSEVYAAVEDVPGVDSAEVTRFQRYGESVNGELAAAVIPADEREILRLNNDRNFPEHGVLELEMKAGK